MQKCSFQLLALILLLAALLSTQPGRAQMAEGAPITVEVSPAVCIAGNPVQITGTTLIGKEVLDVTLTITDPAGKNTSLTATTDKKGDYKLTYNKAFVTGKYTVTAKPADGKNEATATFVLATISGAANDLQSDFMKTTESVQHTLDAVIQVMESIPPSKDIDLQVAKLKEHKKNLGKMKADDEKTAQGIKEIVKQTRDVPAAAAQVSRLMAKIAEANKEFINKLPPMEAKVQSYKNKSQTCEMINNVTEMCGFISLALNFKLSILKTAMNLASDKGIPGCLDRLEAAGGFKGSVADKEKQKMAINTAQKSLIAVAQGAEETAQFVSQGLSLDVCSFIGKIVYSQNCEELAGDATTTFKVTFKADNGNTYAVYDVDLKGKLKLRYSKNTDLAKGAEITGEFTGYRVRYGFKEDFEQVERVPSGLMVLARQALTPRAMDASYFSNDLGAFAASMVPGSYRVSVKGTVVNSDLKLEIVPSTFDNTETEQSNRIFLVLTQPLLPIPVIKYFPVPIAKNRIMFIASIPKGKVFKLVKDKDKVTVTEKNLKNQLEPGVGVKVNTTFNLTLSN